MFTRFTRRASLFAGSVVLLLVGSAVAAEREEAVLGASLDAWNAAFGQPEENPAGLMYSGRFIVRPADGRAWFIEVRYPKGTGATLDEARRQSEAFLPSDAKKVKTYTPKGRPEANVDLWNSKWLAKTLPANMFIGGKPGDLIELHKIFDGKVVVTLIGAGNNP